MKRYFNRESSWLEFNSRVLEIYDRKNLLLGEKLKFLSIFCNNMDEFFMVRVGSLWERMKVDITDIDESGISPSEELSMISVKARVMYERCYDRYEELKLTLKGEGIFLFDFEELSDSEKNELKDKFIADIYPSLTFRVIRTDDPLPLIKNKTINIFCGLRKDGEYYFGNVQMPETVKRLVSIGEKEERKFILLEQLIAGNLDFLFDSYELLEHNIMRIIRNADLNYDDEDADDLLIKVERSIKKRKWGQVVRLDLAYPASPYMQKMLQEKLNITEREIYVLENTLDLTFLDQLYRKKWFSKYTVDEFRQNDLFKKKSVMKTVKEGDVMCHFPYDNFNCILEFLEQAALDNKVVAIKQTLYRVSKNSPILETLIKASNRGKNVTVLLEVKARFDEENNIAWAKRLEKAGVQVILSPFNLKTHAKLLLVVRHEKDGIHTYCHLGTGNYNEKTALTYEDIGIFTADRNIGEDVIQVFNFLASGKEISKSKELMISPFDSRNKFHELIDYEMNEVAEGRKGLIRAKMNSLIDKDIIDKLYKASEGGVKIDLIVRGICGLVPDENIRVRSMVGRFLEHSRIYYFFHGGEEKTYIGSMDLMDRNFDRRVETLCPIKDKSIRKRLLGILDTLKKDTVNSYILREDGSYERKTDDMNFDAHKYFMNGVDL